MRPTFGRALRPLWFLAEDATFLNHGSFGACPKVVLEAQQRLRHAMEAGPDAFFRREVMPDAGDTALRAAAERLAAFVNVEGRQLAFIENATAGVQAVLRSVPLAAGDQVLITDHTYNAVRLMVEARCVESGAVPVVARFPLPADAGEIVANVTAALTPKTKLAIIDHITSPTALGLPLERIVRALRERGVLVLVDGAHGIGQVPLDLSALGAHWYVSNLHKWLFAPKGTAMLYASDAVAASTRPNVVSHYVAMGFPGAFDFMGTRDNTGWLCTPAALDFFESLDPPAARAHNAGLLESATERMAALGASPVGPREMCAAMRSFVLPATRPALPEDASFLMREYWARERIQVHASAFQGALLTRVSAQAYVDAADLRQLGDALDRNGWPGRK